MNDILNTILKDTYTLTQLKHRLNILKSHLLNSFFGNQIEENLPPPDLNWLKSLPTPIYQQFNKDNVYQIFTDLENKINQFQPLIIYLTFEPDDSVLSQIGTFARKTFKGLLLLDTKFDPNLIAGAALVWKGVYKDYSLRAKIEERKAEMLDSFKKFLL